MSLFKNKINIETGQVFSIGGKREVGNRIDENGYRKCNIKDCFGNQYWRTYQVIYAEANQLPKHLWPVDENGRRYEPDHIIPVREGGTDAASNLRLISHKDNSNNESTLKRRIEVSNKVSVLQYDLEGNFIRKWDSMRDAARELGLLSARICDCCKGNRNKHGGFQWRYSENEQQ